MTANPYLLPDDGQNRVINFSGGRSSAYMLRQILDAHGGTLPENVVVLFANTGKELNATLDFVQECSQRWEVPVTWLEYRWNQNAKGGPKDPKHGHAVVNHNSAARNGEPYEEMVIAKAMLPNIAMSFCTSQLKVNPVAWHCQRDLGWKRFRNVIGLRADERRRVEKALMTECTVEHPMYYAGTTKQDVADFWKAQPFDLGIHSDAGNCDLCFKKGRANLTRLIRANPELADWWIGMEDTLQKQPRWIERKLKKAEMATFTNRWTYEELREEALNPRQRDLFEDDDDVADCFCGFDDA